MLDMFPGVAETRFKILATDIDNRSLDTARDGLYGEDMIAGLSSNQIAKHFRKEDDHFRISDEAKRLVCFKHLNLMSDWPMRKAYDAIFCRNVLIYFTAQTQEHLYERFNRLLRLNAYLYVGHSERLTGPAQDSFQVAGSTTYRKIAEFGDK